MLSRAAGPPSRTHRYRAADNGACVAWPGRGACALHFRAGRKKRTNILKILALSYRADRGAATGFT